MTDQLSLVELSRTTGEPEERLAEWRERGLIGRGEEFTRGDIERAHLVQLCLRRGIRLDDIVEAAQRHGLIDRYVEMTTAGAHGSTYSLAEAAEVAGLDLESARRLWAAIGYAVEQGDQLTDDDIEALGALKAFMDAGLPEHALAEGSRVYADSIGRIAEMESKLFHFYVHKRLEASGLSGDDLVKAVDIAGDAARPLIEPTILYFHRKAWQRAIRDDWVMHVAEEAGLLRAGDVPGQLQSAVVFIDLSSFTPLAEAMGDATAADVLERFSRIVRSSVAAFGGRIVKQIGDAFMLIFQDPRAAVACALEIDSEAAKEPQFPAVRAGIQWGDLLYREGDYVGSNVNIAARLASEADRHQVLVTADVRKAAAGTPGIEFARLGKRTLKGLGGRFELFTARPAGADVTSDKHVDPVCGMEMQPSEVAARLNLEGEERCFCSEACLRKFVAAPERYT
jgi:class 3 adenylate cyclase/YHS domain-containing protein